MRYFSVEARKRFEVDFFFPFNFLFFKFERDLNKSQWFWLGLGIDNSVVVLCCLCSVFYILN